MKILVTGASGLIGSRVARMLADEGHEVVCAGRTPPRDRRLRFLPADFAAVPDAGWWLPHLRGFDAVVNAAGIFREEGGQTFDAVHAQAPAELFRACAAAGIRYVVQVSALGAGQVPVRFLETKALADDVLGALPLNSAVVRPSLVFSEAGASSRLFLALAAMPAAVLPANGEPRVQPVHVDDVAAGIVALVDARPAGRRVLAFAGPEAMTLAAYVKALRRGLGFRSRPRVMPLPHGFWHLAAALGTRLRSAWLDRDALRMLEAGSTADASVFHALLGRAPRAPADFVDNAPTARTLAVTDMWAVVLRLAVAFVWLWTAAVSAGLYPLEDSYALLAQLGLHGTLAAAALWGAVGLDLLLGLVTLFLPAPRRPWLWAAQVALIAGYTLLITLALPEQWLHPFGPISKNLPMLAAIGLLWSVDRRARS